MNTPYKYLLILLVFISFQASGQKNPFRLADNFYKKMKFANAIEQYELSLKYQQEAPPEVYKKLANSYYRVGDMNNAERIYRVYFTDTTGLAAKDPTSILEYAKTLAQTGHYKRAAEFYEAYAEIKGNKDPRGVEFRNTYLNNISSLYKDSTLYTVSKVNFNSSQSDFSPTFYQNGIVFCSARKREEGVRRVYGYNNTAFLNLYYLDTTYVEKTASYETDKSKEEADCKNYSYIKCNDELHSDETRFTSNDSYTVGYHGHIFTKYTNPHKKFEAVPFSKALNTKFHEGPVTFNKEQNIILFTRNNYHKGIAKKDKDGINRLKIFMATKKEGEEWKGIQELPFNSNDFSTAHPAFCPDGETVVFASDRPGGFGGSDLYKTTYKNGKWSQPLNLGEKINTKGNEFFPFVDDLGVLYFSSDGHPGLGGLDLFKFEDGELTHLNYPISSKKDDFGVLVWDNGRKGLLSSNRHTGGHDDDIYMFSAQRLLLLAGKVYDKNTGEILTESDVILKDSTGAIIAKTISDTAGNFSMNIDYDKAYALTGLKRAYRDTTESFTTHNVKDKKLKKDLYLWSMLDLALNGLVKDKETDEPLDSVFVKIKDAKTQKNIFETLTLEDGAFRKVLKNLLLNDSLSFQIKLEKDNYLAKTIPFSTIVKDTAEKLVFAMDKIQVGTDIGKILNLEPIYFDLGKWDIRPDAAEELDKVVELMLENPNLVIELGSHTDCRASRAYNQTLSDKRAKASAEYVRSRGISEERIYGQGYGESRLINHCECEGNRVVPCTEEEHQLNRRTEFLVVSNEDTKKKSSKDAPVKEKDSLKKTELYKENSSKAEIKEVNFSGSAGSNSKGASDILEIESSEEDKTEIEDFFTKPTPGQIEASPVDSKETKSEKKQNESSSKIKPGDNTVPKTKKSGTAEKNKTSTENVEAPVKTVSSDFKEELQTPVKPDLGNNNPEQEKLKTEKPESKGTPSVEKNNENFSTTEIKEVSEPVKNEKNTEKDVAKKEASHGIARELLKNGVSIDIIMKSTGLNREEIEGLK